MAKRQVTVVINGEETVSEATGQADSALGGFTSKIPTWAKTVGLLTAAYQLVTAAIGAAKDYVLESFAAYDRFAASQTKLSAQSKLTGISLAELNRIADDGREKFGLSSVTANEAATTVGKYASRAGDATKANALLAAALDLGAASGLDAAASMEALEMGLRGQDEGFDKLLGKNPSSIWKEFADANGLAVGKMTDTEKRMAELTAIMEAGGKVTGSYADRLESGAGAQDKLNNKLDEAKVAFGQATQPLRIFVVQGLTSLVDVGGRVVLAIGRVANAIGVALTGAVEGARAGVGYLVMGIGKLTGNKELEEWGRNQSTAFTDFRAQLAKLEEKYLTTGKAATDSAATQATAVTKVATTTKAATETTAQELDRLNKAIDAKLGKPMQVAIELTEGAITRLGTAATAQLPTVQSEKFLSHMQGLVTASGQARDKIMGIESSTTTGATKTKDMAREVESLARGAIDAATSFGVIDDSAARSLNSAVNIASAVQRMATSGFSFAGAVGVIGGVASLVNAMMAGDTERRRLQRENTSALIAVSRDLNGLKLNLSGEDYANVGGALQTLFGTIRSNPGNLGALSGGLGTFDQRLRDVGLTAGDLQRIADAYGIKIRNSRGDFDLGGLESLMDALTRRGPGQVGQGFGDQLSFFRDTQRASGATGTTAITDLLTFLRDNGNVGALRGIDLTDMNAVRDALFAIRTQMNNKTGLSGGDLGRLSGGAFNDIILEILGTLSSGGSSSTGGDITAPTGSGGGTVSAPTETIQAVIGAMNTNIGTILTGHTAIHERIAVATEGSLMRLTSIDNKMDSLIAVTEGQFTRIDKELAAVRLSAATSSGAGPSF